MSETDPTVELESDGDSDSGAYFLEPTSCTVSIAERIAEANRQLFDLSPSCQQDGSDDPKSPKVKFCESLVDYAPTECPGYSTEDADSVANQSDDDVESESPHTLEVYSETLTSFENALVSTHEDSSDKNEYDVEVESCREFVEVEQREKLLLVLLPLEQSSSCESVIGEEVDCPDESGSDDNNAQEVKEKSDLKTRPKSAHKNLKKVEKVQCKLSPVSPDLNCDVEADNRNWHESQKLKQKTKGGKLVANDSFKLRKDSSEVRETVEPEFRAKTASKRMCCVTRCDLPKYNGLRSEYGLSAEQLQERKVKSAEIRQKRRKEKEIKLQTDHLKRKESREKFGLWLENKAVSSRNGSTSSSPPNKNSVKIDTLLRSDVYIQTNAVYASKCGVSYAVDYSIGKSKNRSRDIGTKTVNLGQLFGNIASNGQKTYQMLVKSSNS